MNKQAHLLASLYLRAMVDKWTQKRMVWRQCVFCYAFKECNLCSIDHRICGNRLHPNKLIDNYMGVRGYLKTTDRPIAQVKILRIMQDRYLEALKEAFD